MIDTIKLKIDFEYLPNNYHDLLMDKLTNIEIRKKESFDFHTINGNFKNLQLSFDLYGLVIQGSLTKYLIGNNLGTLFFEDIKKGINKLSEDLEIDLLNSKVMRLDIAANIITKYPINNYIINLTAIKSYKKLEAPNGVLFNNHSKCISVYDKINELKSKKNHVDKFFFNKNIIRMEYRYLNKYSLNRFFKLNKVKLIDVINNYPNLVEEWSKVMKEINLKRSGDVLMPDVFKNRKSLEKELIILGIEKLGGLNQLYKYIESAKSMKLLSKYPNEVSNIKMRYRRIMSSPNNYNPKLLVDELDKKINLIAFILKQKITVEATGNEFENLVF